MKLVKPVPPLVVANVPASVIVPAVVMGPPEAVRPVAPVEKATDVTWTVASGVSSTDGGAGDVGGGVRVRYAVVSPDVCHTDSAADGLLQRACQSQGEPTIEPLGTASVIDGDAVLVQPDGTTVVLYDGPSPSDQPGGEGDRAYVDHVSLSPDGTRAVVSLCCEPLSGSFVVIDTTTLEQVGSGLGHLVEYTDDGQLVLVSLDGIHLVSSDRSTESTVWAIDDPLRQVVDLRVVGSVVFALSTTQQTSTNGFTHLHRFDLGSDMQLTVDVTTDRSGMATAPYFGDITDTQGAVNIGGSWWLFSPKTLASLPG